jgi:hypothetical protein
MSAPRRPAEKDMYLVLFISDFLLLEHIVIQKSLSPSFFCYNTKQGVNQCDLRKTEK